MITIIDFGSQTTHLISRRLGDLGIESKIIEPEESDFILKHNKEIEGIILSGGPSSVYEPKSPTINPEIFNTKKPILGICYGMQLTTHLLGGQVKPGSTKEFGPATLIINQTSALFNSLSPHSQVWMSHGDYVAKLPAGFKFIAQTGDIKAGAMSDETRKIYGIQFHPEVEHTEHGELILKNFVKICGLSVSRIQLDIPQIIGDLQQKIGRHKAIAAVSGGLDSTVAATLVAQAIGQQLIPVHIDSGLMRPGTTERVIDYFQNQLKIKPIIVYAEDVFLKKISKVTDPEKKRKIIGRLYIDLFNHEVKKIKDVKYLVQGTIYSDVIESQGSKHSANIKSHHNVGGLPKDMKLKLIEPIRQFYTDQVRQIAREIHVPDSIIHDQPHPGPGYAIRIIGAITKERLDMITHADTIIIEEMKKAGWYKKILHSFAILTGTRSTAVKGDGRNYGEVLAIRAIESKDRMTANWAHLPYDLLQKLSSRLVNEIPGISRAVYDITTKPPATMEWE